MKILVTGGCGFIGCNFIRYMIKKPDTEIVNLDTLSYAGMGNNLKDVENNQKYSFMRGNITDRETVSKAMRGCDKVVHFAAESHVDRSLEDVSPFIKTNVSGTYVLLDEARKQDINKFVMISTDEVYGQIEKGSFKESDVLNPRNPYSASKAAAERFAYSFFATYGLPVVITRSSNNFGPYQFPEKIIPLFITNLLRGKSVPLYGDGKNVRDWIHVTDNCDAINVCMSTGKDGEVYNIGGGNEITNIKLTEMILNGLGMGKEMIEFIKDRPGHDLRYSLNCNKIKDQLGWNPKHDFETALKETIRWYMENEAWWKPLIDKQ